MNCLLGIQRHRIYQGVKITVAIGIGTYALYERRTIWNSFENHAVCLFNRTSEACENISPFVTNGIFQLISDDYIKLGLAIFVGSFGIYAIQSGAVGKMFQFMVSVGDSLNKEIIKFIGYYYKKITDAIKWIKSFFINIPKHVLEKTMDLAEDVRSYCEAKLKSMYPTPSTPATPKSLMEIIVSYIKNIEIVRYVTRSFNQCKDMLKKVKEIFIGFYAYVAFLSHKIYSSVIWIANQFRDLLDYLISVVSKLQVLIEVIHSLYNTTNEFLSKFGFDDLSKLIGSFYKWILRILLRNLGLG